MNWLSTEKQLEIIKHNTVEVVPEEELLEKLRRSIRENRPLRVKLGCDPSAPDLHLGHSVVLRKLRQFQDLGHTGILVIGDFTAMIGDPSGKKKTRPALTWDETRQNALTYFNQAGRILDISKLEIRYNSEWLSKLDFADIIRLTSKYTVARILERDDFEKRIKEQIPISLHELLYPMAQAYDSVALNADIELGGTDQKFNLLVGRAIQPEYNQEPQVIITNPLLEGTDGTQKMSKSLGNYIAFEDKPEDMFGKIMSLPDSLIEKYFRLVTDVPVAELAEITKALSDPKTNPMVHKKRLGIEIVRMYYNEDAANAAWEHFKKVCCEHETPEEMPVIELSQSKRLIDIMSENGLATSNSEARRLIRQGAVKIDGATVSDEDLLLSPDKEIIIKAGKRKYLRTKPIT